MISTILQAVANNFGILWPQYWAQFGFDGDAPAVSFFFGPKYLTLQDAPPKIVVVLGDEPFTGAEIHSAMPNAAPRELSRIWTRMHFFCWGAPSVIDGWLANTAETLMENTLPTPANQNGFWFSATVGGTTGTTEPTWPTTTGDTVVDGSVTWTNMGSVDSFRVFDTDQTDLLRTVIAATMHYTLVGSYKPVKGTWYDQTDQLVLDGLYNVASFDILIPIPDLAPNTEVINSLSIDGQINLLF
jgi:hypothetical protein